MLNISAYLQEFLDRAYLNRPPFLTTNVEKQTKELKLTRAVSLKYPTDCVFREGYAENLYVHPTTKIEYPCIIIACDSEKVLDLFCEIIDLIGEKELDIVLESSHDIAFGHLDYYAEGVDLTVLKSAIYDFEDLFLRDGNTGIIVYNARENREVQLNGTKNITVYDSDFRKYERVLQSFGIKKENPDMDFLYAIDPDDLIRHSTPEHFQQFNEFKERFGCEAKLPDL